MTRTLPRPARPGPGRTLAAIAAAAALLALPACSSSTPAASSSTSATSTSATSTSATGGGASTGASTPAGSGSSSGASGSGGASVSVAQLTGSGNGQIDQATYDAAISGAPKADAATVSANAWAAKIKARGSLNTGGTDSGALFSLLDPASGKLTGFDAGLAQMLAQYITGAPTIKLTKTTVDTRETLLQNGTVDTVFATYSITEARAKKVAFAGPYFISGDSIMVKKGSSITKLEDLAGKNVTTESGSTAVDILKAKVPTANLVLFGQDAQCQAAVQQGRADAYVLDQSILISDAVNNPAVQVVGAPFTVDPYGIGVTLADPSAKQFVNAWLQKIYDDGSWAKLWKATIGTVVAGDAPTPPKIGSVAGS